MGRSRCTLTEFERRLFCAKKRVNNECLRLWFLGHRCPYQVWTKEDVIKEARRGGREIRTMGGFTEEAIEYAERFRPGLRLVDGDEIVKPRRRRAKAQLTA
jgi:hypothetical protein